MGFKNNKINFNFPKPLKTNLNANELLEKNPVGYEVSDIAKQHLESHFNDYLQHKKYDKNYPIFATEIRPSRCSWRNDGISPCLTAKMGTGGNNVPVIFPEKRKLTVRECLRLQGFPESFKIKENYSQSYKQIGNSVTVPVLKLIAKEMKSVLN